MNLSKQIKSLAFALGFQKVGLTKVQPIPQAKTYLDSWISAGNHATMTWMETNKEERGDILVYYPGAKSIISVALNYFNEVSETEVDDSPGRLKVSNYAWGRDYHGLIKERMKRLLNSICNLTGNIEGIICVDTAPVMEKVWAQNAGLGWLGKHTNLISRDFGSWLFLGELIVDIELEYDNPFDKDLCGTCKACIEACPTGALAAYRLDARKCISYLTIEHRGDFPLEYQEQLAGWIFGCDICQIVCPWNQKSQKITQEPAFQPKPEIIQWKDDDWRRLNQEKFSEIFKDSPVKRAKFSGLKRNIKAASASGK